MQPYMNTVSLDDSVPDDIIEQMALDSYVLMFAKLPRATQCELAYGSTQASPLDEDWRYFNESGWIVRTKYDLDQNGHHVCDRYEDGIGWVSDFEHKEDWWASIWLRGNVTYLSTAEARAFEAQARSDSRGTYATS
jgi:hypothetical protein